ncbi:MAG: hypothetical protein ACOYBH_02975 [Candidatus Alectryocaccobium sp.]|jgi:hypothetical protein
MLAELVVNPVHLAYGVMVVGIVFTFIFSRRKKGDLRTVSAGFVIPFVQLSNYICPRVPKSHLQVKKLEDGKVMALPKEQQPGEIRAMLQRANEDTSVKLFAKLAEGAAKVQDKAGIDRKEKAHFAEPIEEMLQLTHNFVLCCEDLTRLDSKEKLEQFESYIYEQPKHRYMLMKRLPGTLNDKYSQLNTEYGDEMEELEKAEFEAMKNGKRR